MKTQSSFASPLENKIRRNSICSEYYCWYGHGDCFSEGGKWRYSGGRGKKSRDYRPWKNNHKARGRANGPEGNRNSLVFGGNQDGCSEGSAAQQQKEQEAGSGYQQHLVQNCSQNFEESGSQARIDEQTFYDSFSAGWHFETNNGLGNSAHNSNSRNTISSVKQLQINMNEKVNKDGEDKHIRAIMSIEEIKKQHSKKKTEETSSAQQNTEWEDVVEYQQGLSQHCSLNFEGSGSQAKTDDQSFYDSFSAGWHFETVNGLGDNAHNSNSTNNIGSVKQMEINMNEKVNKGGLVKFKSIEEIKKQQHKKKTEGVQDLANFIDEKSEIADKTARIKEALGSLSGSLVFSSQHQIQECQQLQSPEPDKALASKLMVPDLVQTTSDYAEVGAGKGFEEAAEESLDSSQSSIVPAFHDDQVIPPPSATTVRCEHDPKPRVADVEVRPQIKQEPVASGEYGPVDAVKVLEIPSTCKDSAGKGVTTSSSGSPAAASGPTDPLDSATRFAPVHKKRRRVRMIGGYEVVIGTIGELVNVQENETNEAENENHVEINLDIETSPDGSIEQVNSNKMKSFGLIFKEELRLLSDLQSVDSKITSLVHERSSVVKQLLFLSQLKSQMLK